MRRRCTDQPTHSPTLDYSSTLYGTAVKHSAQQKTSTTTNPRTHHVCTTVQQQQYSSTAEKNKSKKAGTGGFEPTYLGLAEKTTTSTETGWGIWTDALLVQNRALYRWAKKRKCSDSLPSPGGQLWNVVARQVWLLYRYLWLVFVANHGRIFNTTLSLLYCMVIFVPITYE